MKIKTETEFARSVDAYADVLSRIESLQGEARLMKALLELYANETGTKTYRTANNVFRMVRGTSALKRKGGVSEDAVVALLKASETMRVFVRDTYDGDGIKAHAASLDDPDETLAAFGLYLTEAGRHAKVCPLR